jgi:ubiquinone/menaquinone biosynthesis C-methylase UbiE
MPARQQVSHPLFARFYARISTLADAGGVAQHREQLLAGLVGTVIEVGAGNGKNFAHYPPTVTKVLAVEPEPHLRALAEQSAREAPVPITVVDGTAEHLPADDGSFDAVVATLMLCSVPDVSIALAEMRRVLHSGGQLRFMEHVASQSPGEFRLQRLVEATFWPLCFGGCHPSRDPVAAIAAAGFTVTELRKFRFPESRLPSPTALHAEGIAILN